MADARRTFRIGVDIGGTFTDIVVIGDDGSLARRKVSSTPADYSKGIVEGLEELISEAKLTRSAIAEIIHGTTVATNAILEHKGALTGLITTKGFRDVLEIRRLRMPELYNLLYEKPAPLVERLYRDGGAGRNAEVGRIPRRENLVEEQAPEGDRFPLVLRRVAADGVGNRRVRCGDGIHGIPLDAEERGPAAPRERAEGAGHPDAVLEEAGRVVEERL